MPAHDRTECALTQDGDADSLVTNYINDKLHSHMWASVFGEEQTLRREEGLPPLSVPWTDPRPPLDLIEHVRR